MKVDKHRSIYNYETILTIIFLPLVKFSVGESLLDLLPCVFSLVEPNLVCANMAAVMVLLLLTLVGLATGVGVGTGAGAGAGFAPIRNDD